MMILYIDLFERKFSYYCLQVLEKIVKYLLKLIFYRKEIQFFANRLSR